MTCAMRSVASDSFHKSRALTPSPITKNLHRKYSAMNCARNADH